MVCRIEHLGDVLGFHLGFNRAYVIALIEEVQVKVTAGFGVPESQGVDGVVPVTGNRHIVGQGHDFVIIDPGVAHHAVPVGIFGDPPAVADRVQVLLAGELPGVVVAQPVVRHLMLSAVNNLLVKHAVFIADAVAVSRELHGGHGVKKTGCQPSQTAVAKAGVPFRFLQVFNGESQLFQSRIPFLHQAQIDQGVAQGAAHQEFHGDVVDPLCIIFVIGLLRVQPAVCQQIPHRVGQGQVQVGFGSGKFVLHQGVLQVVDKSTLEVCCGWSRN